MKTEVIYCIPWERCTHSFGLKLVIEQGQGSLVCPTCGITRIGTVRFSGWSRSLGD